MNGVQRPPVWVLMGPTATGKTDLAVELAQTLPCEIISVDSSMVYRGLDIGTAKPDPATLRRAPHRLIDICDPCETYSAARFRDDALRHIEAIHAAGRIPLLVGGTLLYFRALLHGLSALPGADAEVRRQLSEILAHDGLGELHRRLHAVDPVAAARIHPNDPQRVLRALEVHALTGQSLSSLQRARGEALASRAEVLGVALFPADRAALHRRIAHRFEAMLASGLIAEVERLQARGDLDAHLPAVKSVGYRQIWRYLLGEITYAEMVEQGIAATRQLAKRQMTWLRQEQSAVFLDPEGLSFHDKVKFMKQRFKVLD
ncbi:MAG: tRNA (adenosine(37)-N6)-dimethylallyltransferase MiaA [Thiotrichales bacterium]